MRILRGWLSDIKETWSSNPERRETKSASIDSQLTEVETPWGYLLSFAVVGAVVVAAYYIKTDYRQMAFTLTLAVCAMVIGIFLGFLFVVPRTVQTAQETGK